MLKKKFEEIKNNPQNRMNAVLLLIAIVIGFYALVSYAFISKISNDALESGKDRQEAYCKLLSNQLGSLIEQGESDESLIEYIENNVEVEGDSWPFLIKDETVIFAKNRSTTQSLKKKAEKSIFVQELEEQEQIINMIPFSENYLVGIITDKKRFAMTEGTFFFALIMGSFAIFSIAGILYATGCWTKNEKKLIQTSEELRVRNEEFEIYKNKNEEYYSTTPLKIEEGLRSNRYKQYAFKFYINARHAIFIDGKLGAMHPHTWELHLNVMKVSNDFVQFNEIEKAIRELIMPFQDKEINSIEPFNVINPTLENCCNYFRDEIAKILKDKGWLLLMIEMSETPSRSYVVNMIAEDT